VASQKADEEAGDAQKACLDRADAARDTAKAKAKAEKANRA
jgi:hypothetical protein